MTIDSTVFTGPIESGVLDSPTVKLDPSSDRVRTQDGQQVRGAQETPFSRSPPSSPIFLSSPPSLCGLGYVDKDAN